MGPRHKSLEQLGAAPSVVPDGKSHVSSELRRLRTVPLMRLRMEDLRFLIGQGVGLELLVPIALEHLEQHPLVEADFYPGDLLRNVADVDETFWSGRSDLRASLVRALDGALLRIRKVNTLTKLAGELNAALTHHTDLLRK